VSLLSAALQFVLTHPLVVRVIPEAQTVRVQKVAALDAAIPPTF
jgi:hypothetical protein